MGITLKTGTDVSLDMSDYDLNLASLTDATILSTSRTTITGRLDGYKVVIRGDGFHFDDGVLDDGIIFGFEVKDGSSLFSSISGLRLSVDTIEDLIEDGTLSDIRATVKKAFAGSDSIAGGDDDDVLLGYAGDDILTGRRGDDILTGGAGKDRLIGGLGADILKGEQGADSFIYTSTKDSNAELGTDLIKGFSLKSGDAIDLSAIDANTLTTGNGSFSFIGTKAFSGKAGQLRYEKIDGDSIISGDTNGDGVADLVIRLDTAVTVSKDFFDL